MMYPARNIDAMVMARVLLLMVTLAGVWSQPAICPYESPCECRYAVPAGPPTSEKQFMVKCKNKNLLKLPKIIIKGAVAVADFSYNSVKRVRKGDFDGLSCEQLNLRNNKLLGIHKEAMKPLTDSLKRLDLSRNDFKMVPVRALGTLKSLEYLTFASNAKPAGPLEKIPAKAFFGLNNLKTLILSGQKLSNVHASAFIGLEQTLEDLDFSGASFVYFPSAVRLLSALKKLNLKKSGKYKIKNKAFKGMNSLEYLDLSEIDLSRKGAMDDRAFLGIESTLEYLSMRSCNLLVLPNTVKSLYKLKTLDLYGNKIVRLRDGSFLKLTSLQDLNIGGFNTNFTVKLFEGVSSKLMSLRISTADLSYLPEGTLKALPNLKEIDLSKNLFATIPAGFTNGASVLKYNLDYNDITTISKLAFSRPLSGGKIELSLKRVRIRTVTFAGNPCIFSKIDLERSRFQCDCNLHRLIISGVDVIGMCSHKNGPVSINQSRFKSYYGRKCGSKLLVNCEESGDTTVFPEPEQEITKKGNRSETTENPWDILINMTMSKPDNVDKSVDMTTVAMPEPTSVRGVVNASEEMMTSSKAMMATEKMIVLTTENNTDVIAVDNGETSAAPEMSTQPGDGMTAQPEDMTTQLEDGMTAQPEDMTTQLGDGMTAQPEDMTTPLGDGMTAQPEDMTTQLGDGMTAQPEDMTTQLGDGMTAQPEDMTTQLGDGMTAQPEDMTTKLGDGGMSAQPEDMTTKFGDGMSAQPEDMTTQLGDGMTAQPEDVTTQLGDGMSAQPENGMTSVFTSMSNKKTAMATKELEGEMTSMAASKQLATDSMKTPVTGSKKRNMKQTDDSSTLPDANMPTELGEKMTDDMTSAGFIEIEVNVADTTTAEVKADAALESKPKNGGVQMRWSWVVASCVVLVAVVGRV